ncbi:MAG: hypothetical protein CL583_19410 [Alteromonadaceae bacterium]|nr:hypothetical protein [Alteromonadaceae bacterium]|tara:strand:+ start:5355 stop:5771 length:417 start_codon:yes stop_codon:yes gene_type:complete
MEYELIEALIKKEQISSRGQFIKDIALDDYLKKIKSNAEFVSHYAEGQCVGFVAFYCNDPSRRNAFITLVLVSPDFRGQGISQKLIRYVLDICKKRRFEACSLEVLRGNQFAVQVYKRIGFKIVSERNGKIFMRTLLG